MGQIYKNIERYVDRLDNPGGSFIEIGSSRPGDDQSTQYLANLAKNLGMSFVTCDINKERVAELNSQGISATCLKGEEFIPMYAPKISIAYLDNFDWNWHPMATEDWTLVQIREYRERYNIDMTNLMSQSAHVHQAVLIESRTTEKSIVCIDDTWFDSGWDTYQGKGGAAVPYLIAQGYTVLETTNGKSGEYGIILGRFG